MTLLAHETPLTRTRSIQRTPRTRRKRDSRLATSLYTHSYLVLFALLGTLARLGLQALTRYPDAPVTFSVLWANVGGSFTMGFLVGDQKLFRSHDESENQRIDIAEPQGADDDRAKRRPSSPARRAHLATKKAIPLYIGLTTGFCGSFTSFSTFTRDMFLATSDDLPSSSSSSATGTRNGGSSFLALLAVLISTVALSLSALVAGTHLAVALHDLTPSFSSRFLRNCLDHLVIPVAWGAWLAAVLLAAMPPHGHDLWRGQALFALVFAPLGCVLRYRLAVLLNPWVPSFPLGTFAANMLGTAVLGMAWDLVHAPGAVGGLVGCQVLFGIEDGFCGCLTTVSTWVAELVGLRKSLKHAYVYGVASVVLGYGLLIAIMGGLRWGPGFSEPQCT